MKIVFFISMTSYIFSIISAIFAYVWQLDNGTESPIYASALACIFFFLSCGVVLQTIANANVPSFKVNDHTDD